MKVDAMLSDLTYQGEASGMRQMYYVFEGSANYLVLSFSRAKPNAGYFNIVDREAVDCVRKRFAGEKRLTSKDLRRRCAKPEHIKTALQALNILYVLTAVRQAQVDSRFHDRELHLSVKG